MSGSINFKYEDLYVKISNKEYLVDYFRTWVWKTSLNSTDINLKCTGNNYLVDIICKILPAIEEIEAWKHTN